MAKIGVPYLLGENRFSELFDEILEKRIANYLREQTDKIIEQRRAEDAARESKADNASEAPKKSFLSRFV